MSSASLSSNGQLSRRTMPDVTSSLGHESGERNPFVHRHSSSLTSSCNVYHPYTRPENPPDTPLSRRSRVLSPRLGDCSSVGSQQSQGVTVMEAHVCADKVIRDRHLSPKQSTKVHRFFESRPLPDKSSHVPFSHHCVTF